MQSYVHIVQQTVRVAALIQLAKLFNINTRSFSTNIKSICTSILCSVNLNDRGK
jgi:hypothetical protein